MVEENAVVAQMWGYGAVMMAHLLATAQRPGYRLCYVLLAEVPPVVPKHGTISGVTSQ